MKMSDLNNLTFDNIGTWPVPVKLAFAVIVFALICGGGWYQFIKAKTEELAEVEQQEVQKKTTFEAKQRKASNLEALKQQLADMQETFGELLTRLPSKTEVAELLVDISKQGLGAGLEFEVFDPAREQPADFYVELPIQIKVVGDYHEFGTFISGVSELPRIVTNHNINIKPDASGKLSMTTTAKTYRYIDDEEEG